MSNPNWYHVEDVVVHVFIIYHLIRTLQMNWIWSNKEWIFSGVGVAIVVAVFEFFRRQRTAGHSGKISASRNSSVVGSPVASGSNISQTVIIHAGPTQPAAAPKTYSPSPTPIEIADQLKSLPLYLRSAATKSYIGMDVSWPVMLVHLTQLPDYRSNKATTHRLSLMFGRNFLSLPQVEADINIERFPRLRISHEGTAMQISGTILSVSEIGTIALMDVNIKFDSEQALPDNKKPTS